MNLAESKLAFLWDMDGTIIDSGECHYISWKETFNKHGFDLDRHVFYQNFGQNNQACMPIYLGFEPSQELFEQISLEKEALFRKLALEQATLVKGVESWLREAKNAGMIQVITSSAPMDNITALIDRFELSSYFDDLISGFEFPAKPAPDIFLKAADMLKKPVDCCCVIEDSIPGITAAKKAGMPCIAVSTTRPPSELYLADYVLEDFTFPLGEVLNALSLPQACFNHRG
jgi:HAD superfamily hydrolase (TIGR01509 family)